MPPEKMQVINKHKPSWGHHHRPLAMPDPCEEIEYNLQLREGGKQKKRSNFYQLFT